ncbi:MAG TPA: hypothetical protein VD905_13645, partial [Flavobacteriales bacterium]|nr:hypothetical protein [Flavobacteriales bacterium]
LLEIAGAIASETKSTAGDKHETTRALMQLEQEKLHHQLHELVLQKNNLEKYSNVPAAAKIRTGNLIETDRVYIYLSVGIGKLTVENIPVMVISPQSPLGAKFLGLGVNQQAEMNGMVYVIKKIL